MNLMYGFGISYKPGKARGGGLITVFYSVFMRIHRGRDRRVEKAHSCMRMNAGGGVTFPKFCVRTE